MASADEVFYKEFKRMMNELKAEHGYVSLQDIPMPPELYPKMKQDRRDIVAISQIDDEYYKKLSGTTALLWGRTQLKRRKYDYKGEFMKNKDGSYIWIDVDCPTDCVAVISDLPIGVPLKYKPKEKFNYVDVVTKTVDGQKLKKYVYIVPKKYCYKINQTALVMSWNKLRVYYSGITLALQTGTMLNLYIIPYKPTSNIPHNYRIIMTKPSIDYESELAAIQKYWIDNKIIFDPSECEMLDEVNGVTNPALQTYDGVLEDYIMFDANRALGDEETLEEFDETEETDDDQVS